MAQRGGIFTAFRNIFRFAIWALAGLLVAALWFNWQAGDDVVAVAPDVVLPEIGADAAPVTEAVEETAEEAVEEAPEISDPVADVVVEASNAADAAADEVEEAVADVAEAVEAVEDTVAEVVETVEEATDAVQEGVVEAVEDAATDATPTDTTTISIPGTDTSFTLINAFRRDNGLIEATTEQLTGGTGATLWLISCAPLAVGEIATGPSAGELSPRVDAPEMTEITLSDARAMIAATACGVMR